MQICPSDGLMYREISQIIQNLMLNINFLMLCKEARNWLNVRFQRIDRNCACCAGRKKTILTWYLRCVGFPALTAHAHRCSIKLMPPAFAFCHHCEKRNSNGGFQPTQAEYAKISRTLRNPPPPILKPFSRSGSNPILTCENTRHDQICVIF